MTDVIAGMGATPHVDFMSALGTIIADVGSVSYYLYDQTGSLIRGPVAIVTFAGSTGVNVPLTGTDHTVSGGRRFEKRRVVVVWTSNGESFNHRFTYRVIPLLNYTASEADVRSLLGLSEDELPNEEIDLLTAYFSVESQLTAVVLEGALASGTSVELSANALIVVEAAIASLPSLQTRTPMVQADGTKRWERFRTPPNWELLRQQLSGRRSDLVAEVTGTPRADQPLAVFASPADVITG